MFLTIPNLCYKFNAMLQEKPENETTKFTYKNYGVTYSDYDLIQSQEPALPQ